MSRREKVLVVILRVWGIGSLSALVPVFMPMSWMHDIHRWLGLGEMPTSPIVEYLARSLSAFYAFVGLFIWALSWDLERYRPLVRLLALAFALLSLIFTGIDLSAGLPWWWAAFEGPPGIAFGALLWSLARPPFENADDQQQQQEQQQQKT
jgi:hypothetical protein